MRQLAIDGREVPIVAPPEQHGRPERLFELSEAPAGSLSLADDEDARDEFEAAA